ncbi:hypothetical protein ACOM2C_18430 [Pseudarthrobacter sp. So.54]
MDGNEGPEDKLRSVLAMGGRAPEEVTVPRSRAGLIESWRRLEELSSALAAVTTRPEVAVVLSRVPMSASGVGTTPMANEAVDRLLVAVNNVVAFRDT